jgi:hypothetical protein
MEVTEHNITFYVENSDTGHLNIFVKYGKIQTHYEQWVDQDV